MGVHSSPVHARQHTLTEPHQSSCCRCAVCLSCASCQALRTLHPPTWSCLAKRKPNQTCATPPTCAKWQAPSTLPWPLKAAATRSPTSGSGWLSSRQGRQLSPGTCWLPGLRWDAVKHPAWKLCGCMAEPRGLRRQASQTGSCRVIGAPDPDCQAGNLATAIYCRWSCWATPLPKSRACHSPLCCQLWFKTRSRDRRWHRAWPPLSSWPRSFRPSWVSGLCPRSCPHQRRRC